MIEDTINNKYYSQTYQVSSDVEIKDYSIVNTKDFPKNTIITDKKNSAKTIFLKGEEFKVLIPKNTAKDSNIKGTINIKATCKSYPVFYGVKNSKLQPYAVTYSEYSNNNTAKVTLEEKMNKGTIKIVKNDAETKQPVANVTFQLKKQDGTIIASATTDKNGLATFSGLFEGNYILKETKTSDYYVLSQKEFEVNVKYNKTTSKTIENDRKKGSLKIYKVDADNNKIRIPNVEFQLYSEELKKVIGNYYTNEKGELKIENLRIRKLQNKGNKNR